MATQAEVAFRQKVAAILAQVDNLAEDAVRRALELLEFTREHILTELGRMPADSFSARHLSQLKRATDGAIAELVKRYQRDTPGLLAKAEELGIEMVEQPLKAAGQTVVSELVPQTLIDVMQGYSADLITGLGAEARRRINAELNLAALGAKQPYEAIQAIAGALPNRSVFSTLQGRATAIYRTEVNRMFSISNQARMNQMAERNPAMKKTWVTAGDDRVRPAHAAAEGQTVLAIEAFNIAGFAAMFPRDPILPPQLSINCRCHAVPHVDAAVIAGIGATL